MLQSDHAISPSLVSTCTHVIKTVRLAAGVYQHMSQTRQPVYSTNKHCQNIPEIHFGSGHMRLQAIAMQTLRIAQCCLGERIMLLDVEITKYKQNEVK